MVVEQAGAARVLHLDRAAPLGRERQLEAALCRTIYAQIMQQRRAAGGAEHAADDGRPEFVREWREVDGQLIVEARRRDDQHEQRFFVVHADRVQPNDVWKRVVRALSE